MKPHLLSQIKTLHQEVDTRAQTVASRNTWLSCGVGCSKCCIDDLTVFTIEADLIELEQKEQLQGARAHSKGWCAFLSDTGGCRIYESRPYVCRTQGLPLRWHDDPSDPQSPEHRDVCPSSTPPEPLEVLPSSHFFTLGDIEGKLATLQMQHDPQMTRIPLRTLFAKLSGTEE